MLPYRPVLTDDYNLYLKGAKSVSCASGIELPEITPKTETVDGAGVLGEFDEPAMGQFENLIIKIPFTHLSTECYSLLNTLQPPEITIRSAIQGVIDSGESDAYGLKIVARGKNTSFAQGTLSKGAKSDTSIDLSLLYYKVEINGEVLFELDKLAYICRINGEDIMAKVRALL